MTSSYIHKRHASSVLRGLSDLREEDQFCDSILQSSDGQQFPVHKCVLVAASPYFRAMFTGKFTEATSQPGDPIALPGTNANGLKPLLDCLYSGELTVSDDTVYDIVPTAHMWQLPDVLESCMKHLRKKMSLETCFKSLRLAEKYELLSVHQSSERFIRNNFVEFSDREDFKEMSCDEVCRYLEEVNGVEIELFRAAKRWLDFKPERRENTTEVMGKINFNLISSEHLTSEVLRDEQIVSNKQCYNMALDAVNYHSNSLNQPLNASHTLRGRDTLIIFSSENRMFRSKLSDVLGGKKKTCKPVQSTHPVNSSKAPVTIVKMNNFVFVFGTDVETMAPCAKRFDASTGNWINLAPPPRMAPLHWSTVGVDRFIIMVGGLAVTERDQLNKITKVRLNDETFCYDVKLNEWKTVAKCPIKVARHSSTAYRKFAFIAGGLITADSPNQMKLSNNLNAYDLEGDIWLSKSYMTRGRVEGILETVNDHLYIVGGRVLSNEYVCSTEVYSIQDNQWTTLEEEGLHTHTCTTTNISFVHGNCIYVLGGSKIRVLDSETNKFTLSDLDLGIPACSVCTIVKM